MWTRRLVLPQELGELVFSCETVCIADCCGLDAFEFSAGRFDAWFREKGGTSRADVTRQLDDLIRGVSAQQEENVHCDELNASWTKEQAAGFLKGLKQLIEGGGR